ncbi:MAG TPA: ABC transporter substrate binding protein [Methylomirabilota bacterium]|jgi:putative ABC transport system substrate-binding protein
MLDRRRFLAAIGSLVVTPLDGDAQSRRLPRLGVLWLPAGPDARLEAFKHALRDRGWVEHRTLAFEYRFADGNPDRLGALAEELVRLKVDVIFTLGDAVVRAAKQASASVPIVAFGSGFVETGHAASLAHPGGNVTGVSDTSQELSAKRLDLLRHAVPKLARVAVMERSESC